MKKGLVSIVVPVYNVEDYILRCLKSISGQSYEKLEILVVDDGATDGSGRLCDDFAKADRRVQVFHKKNGGLSDARNFGIKKARGEFIALVDSDDYVDKDFIRNLYAGAIEGGADIAVCGYNGTALKAGVMSGAEAAVRLLVEQENVDIVAWNKLYRRELFDKILYPVGRKYEDSLTTYKLLAAAKKVAYVWKTGYFYEEQRVGSIMNSSKNKERLKVRFEAATEACEYFKNEEKLLAAAKVAVLTARFAFVDAAIKGLVDEKYLRENLGWVKRNWWKYAHNLEMTGKLRLYILLVRMNMYVVFRRVLFCVTNPKV